MKSLIIFVTIATAIYFFVTRETVIDRFMNVDYPTVVTEDSGVKEYTPERGKVVEMSDLAVSGLINIIHIYKPSCNGCKIMNRNIGKLLALRPDIAVTPVVSSSVVSYQARSLDEILNIKFVPFIIVFDRNGVQVAINDGDDRSGTDFVSDWLNAEVAKKNKQLKEEWLSKQ